jgi:hypothetical protein
MLTVDALPTANAGPAIARCTTTPPIRSIDRSDSRRDLFVRHLDRR